MKNNTLNSTVILLIEDNKLARNFLSEKLESRGYKVIGASSGSEGLEKFDSEKIDIVIADIRISPSDGLNVLSTINQQSQDTPVIVLSRAEGIQDLKLAFNHGAYDFFTKDEVIADPERLFAAIRRAVNTLRLIYTKAMLQRQLERNEINTIDRFRQISHSEKKHRAIMAKAPSGLATIATGGKISSLNDAFVSILGFNSKDQLLGLSIYENKIFVDSGIANNILTYFEQQENASSAIVQQYVGPDEKNRHIEYTLTWFALDEYGFEEEVILTVKDVTLEREENIRLAKKAMYDELTGLIRQGKFTEKLKEEIHKVKLSRQSLSLVHIDLDNFGNINKKYKHYAASEILSVVGSRINQSIDKNRDLAFRVGGDEFAVIFSDYENGSLKNIISRLFSQLSKKYSINDGERNHVVKCTFSVGISSYSPDKDQSAEILYNEADEATLAAKMQGKNRCIFFEALELAPF